MFGEVMFGLVLQLRCGKVVYGMVMFVLVWRLWLGIVRYGLVRCGVAVKARRGQVG